VTVELGRPGAAFALEPGALTVESIRVMRGASYFSGGPVVIFRVNLGAYDEVFSDALEGFGARLAATVPSLIEHHCSEGRRGGFLERVRRGTLLGHITEHVAIELQTLAGMDVAYGKTRSTTEQGVYNVVFRYFDEVAGVSAGIAAVNLVNTLVAGGDFDVSAVVGTLVAIREERMLGPSTAAIVAAASERGVPWLRLDAYNLVQLGTGRWLQQVRATVTSRTPAIALETADDTLLTLRMLADAGVPVVQAVCTDAVEEAVQVAARWDVPAVVTPREGADERAVSVDVVGEAAVRRAVAQAQAVDRQVLLYPTAPGSAFRLLVIGGRLVAAARMERPRVIGDGRATVGELVERLNAEPERAVGDKGPLTRVAPDERLEAYLAEQGLDLDTAPAAGTVVWLAATGSLRTGGAAHDVTDHVHPMNRYLVERAARTIGLDVAGVDLMCPSIARPVLEGGGAVTAVRGAPDFRPHLMPVSGRPRDPAGALVETLLPSDQPSRAPIVSVTGTAGKTTTVNLLAHCMQQMGQTVGMTSTEGLFVGGRRLLAGDMTYPEHVALVLKDRSVDSVVLETSREGILRAGLGYELADVGVVLNVHDDHVGADDIQLLEDLAYAKSVVAEQVYDDGLAVLNADQELVLEMRDRVTSRLALISVDYWNEVVQEHLRDDGLAVVVDGPDLVILDGSRREPVVRVEDVPLAFGGAARQSFENLAAAAAALYGLGLSVDAIRHGLLTFRPDSHTLPGRMNLIELGDRGRALVDYAHNRAAYERLAEFLADQPEAVAVAALDAPGDRPDHEITELGRLAAQAYATVVLYEDADLRGRRPGEIAALLRQGALAGGLDEAQVLVADSPEAAWDLVLDRVAADTLAVILTERGAAAVERVLGRIRRGGSEP
jgi:cyanophycin synthetase